MPVSVVVGGQFGSEGKGKAALEIARRSSETPRLHNPSVIAWKREIRGKTNHRSERSIAAVLRSVP